MKIIKILSDTIVNIDNIVAMDYIKIPVKAQDNETYLYHYLLIYLKALINNETYLLKFVGETEKSKELLQKTYEDILEHIDKEKYIKIGNFYITKDFSLATPISPSEISISSILEDPILMSHIENKEKILSFITTSSFVYLLSENYDIALNELLNINS